jgi:hypothetical protein
VGKGYVILDLSATAPGGPGVEFRRYGPGLPRADKQALERRVCSFLLTALNHQEQLAYTSLRSNDRDPPDILFDLPGATIGVELTELLPPGRLHKDAEIRTCRHQVLDALQTGELTHGWWVSISTHDDYAPRLRLRNAAQGIAAALGAFFANAPAGDGPCTVKVPTTIEATIRSMSAQRSHLTGDPRLAHPDHPLITFTAQHTNLVPYRQFPEMVRRGLGPKLSHSVAGREWLLLWSTHPSLARFDGEIVAEIDKQIQTAASPYERLFYVHFGPRVAIHEVVADAA